MRLIDADELPITETWALVNSDNKSSEGISFAPLRCVLKKDIDNAPTVDTTFKEVVAYECGQKSVERPTGEWKETRYETAIGITYRQTQCSNCGWEHELPMWLNFCPNCGADMRGKENDKDSN